MTTTPGATAGPTGDLSVIRLWGWSRFAAAVRRELPRHGATRWYSAIVRAVYDALRPE